MQRSQILIENLRKKLNRSFNSNLTSMGTWWSNKKPISTTPNYDIPVIKGVTLSLPRLSSKTKNWTPAEINKLTKCQWMLRFPGNKLTKCSSPIFRKFTHKIRESHSIKKTDDSVVHPVTGKFERIIGGSEKEPLMIGSKIHLLTASVKWIPSQLILTDGSLQGFATMTSVPFTRFLMNLL